MGASIAFLHPGDLGGVLTELVEARGEWDLRGCIGCRNLKATPEPGMQ
jgi:hypothetical protein